MKHRFSLVCAVLAVILLQACGGSNDRRAKAEPAKVENKRPEAELTRITFTDDAVRRIGVEIGEIERRSVVEERLFTGVITPAPGTSSLVVAPFDGVVIATDDGLPTPGVRLERGAPVLMLRGVAAQMAGVSPDQAIRVRRVERENARARLKRTLDLIAVEGASEEDAERARAEVAQAEAAYESVRTQIDLVDGGQGTPIAAPIAGLLGDYIVGVGQMVRAGDPLFRVTSLDAPLIRVPVFSSDLEKISRDASARISRLGSQTPLTTAARIEGPPTATMATASIDVYFLAEEPRVDLRPGERVGVAMSFGKATPRPTAPLSSIFTDIYGGVWVYEAEDANTYTRRRVMVDYLTDDLAVLAKGPPAGTRVVTAGVAELAGSEFGVGK